MITVQATDIAGRVAVITGAARGIGRAFAATLAAQGASVVIADSDGEAAAKTARVLAGAGGRVISACVDIADTGAVSDLRDRVLDAFGAVDILVNNAAVMSSLERRPFWDIPAEEFDRVLQVNVGGSFRVSAALVPTMSRRGWGRIVNMSSATVLNGHPNYLHYVASKAALQGMTRSMARELAGTGITVNALLPGQIVTGDGANAGQTPEAVARVLSRQFVQRSGRNEDLTGFLVWLASSASDFATGQSFVIDGGFAMN